MTVSIFNPGYYGPKYPDLGLAGLRTNAQLTTHWLNHGMAEGRSPDPTFHAPSYVARYPDLRAAFGSNYTALYAHYINYGIAERRNGAEGSSVPAPAPAPSGLSAHRGELTISPYLTSFAGAIGSIVFRGKQFVNAHDHGRLFQTAMQVDGYGECNNPTEAGSASGVSSRLMGSAPVGAYGFATQVQAANWSQAPNGQNYCPKGSAPGVSGPLSTTLFSKRVDVLDDNVVEWRVAYDTPSINLSLGIEILTGYMPITFDKVFYLTPTGETNEVSSWVVIDDPLDGYPDNGTSVPTGVNVSHPVILSTSDKTFAIGAYRPKSNVKPCESFGYQVLRFILGTDRSNNANSCMKFSVVSHSNAPCYGPRGDFLVYLVFGTFQEVYTKMNALVASKP